MGKYDDIKKEIKDLIKTGEKLIEGVNAYGKLFLEEQISDEEKVRESAYFFVYNYEQWYSVAYRTIKTVLPERADDFSILYRNEKRKEITWKNYTISDAIQGVATTTHTLHPGNAFYLMIQQVNFLKACLDRFDKKVYDIQVILQADVFDSEIDSARHLLKMGFLRAAGAICGVVIEKHLCFVCDNRGIALRKKAPTIADYNDSLKDVAYDTVEWRRIQHLGDLRNLCDHNKKREPTKEEVEDLISGTDRIIKNIF